VVWNTRELLSTCLLLLLLLLVVHLEENHLRASSRTTCAGRQSVGILLRCRLHPLAHFSLSSCFSIISTSPVFLRVICACPGLRGGTRVRVSACRRKRFRSKFIFNRHKKIHPLFLQLSFGYFQLVYPFPISWVTSCVCVCVVVIRVGKLNHRSID
jgi:hypothetical protein